MVSFRALCWRAKQNNMEASLGVGVLLDYHLFLALLGPLQVIQDLFAPVGCDEVVLTTLATVHTFCAQNLPIPCLSSAAAVRKGRIAGQTWTVGPRFRVHQGLGLGEAGDGFRPNFPGSRSASRMLPLAAQGPETLSPKP